MHLSADMRAELDRRLQVIASEQHNDPAFRDLPTVDVLCLLLLLVLAIMGTILLQAS